MNTAEQIAAYITGQPGAKQAELQELDRLIRRLSPGCTLWFLDGRNGEGKVVANPNIGYGSYTIKYADGTSRKFYQVGLSANTTGISVYIMGIADKTYLARTYGAQLGKASITGYCIKFRTLKNIDLDTLEAAIQYGFEAGDEVREGA
ncbi:DUF1801 domain-containing protein [Taibaiella chishuiensis]|uniref:Uncharacterized protein DUF1801 n=1 Tax=Taibaiella chishuiensis TaxID=1434707 RepID=A0A2P8D2W0_9BACT|nr:DUF1801 domain-containing protein [Taibaiella chishuiensis]PSK91543.1 uncharacterized protein DUF1801 [Taibaiella chishuiensis]